MSTEPTGRVALVAGATRGAGRAIAVELARAGVHVYATGRSSRVSGRSEIDRPETIEETGDLMAATGGAGTALVVDHEDPAAVARLVARVEAERSENMLDGFGVREDNWRDALARVPGFAISESPAYVGRGVAALAGDPDAGRFAGRILTSRDLADAYGVTDTDGSRPDCWGYIKEHGIDEQSGAGVEKYR